MDKQIEISKDMYGAVSRLERYPLGGRFQAALIVHSEGADQDALWFNDKLEFEQFIDALVAAKDEIWPAEVR
jgi:hypothetical protein